MGTSAHFTSTRTAKKPLGQKCGHFLSTGEGAGPPVMNPSETSRSGPVQRIWAILISAPIAKKMRVVDAATRIEEQQR
jgi:hypothetical protein